MKKEKSTKIPAIITVLVSAVYLVGTLTFFRPCGPKEDGSFMHCHTAGVALTVLAVILLALSAADLCIKGGIIKNITAAVYAACGVLMILIPGTLIPLCMMPEMRCRADMRPGAVIFGILLILLSCLKLIQNRKNGTN